jgi:tetratricopeptide (TPR) repeat protein
MMNFAYLILTTALLVGCGPSHQDPTAKLSPSVDASIQLLPKITEDIDRRGNYTEKIAETVASVGYLNKAVEVVAFDPSAHGPYTLYSLAIQMARKGDMSSARDIDRKAQALAKDKGHTDSRMVMIQAAIARSALMDDSGAERALQAITTPYDQKEAETGVIAEKIRSGRITSGVTTPLATPAITEAWCALSLKASPSDRKQFLDNAVSNARITFPVQRPMLLALCAETARTLGMQEEASRYLAEAIAASALLSDLIEDGPIEKAKIASILAEFGDKDKARDMLDKARVASRLPASFFLPPGLVSVAVGYVKLGDRTKADEVWLEAAHNAKGHVHPNARVINSIEIYLSHIRAGVEPSADVVAVLKSIERGEGGDGVMTVSPEIEQVRKRYIKQTTDESKKKLSTPDKSSSTGKNK